MGLISNPNDGKSFFNTVNRLGTISEDVTIDDVFRTSESVLFSPLTDGLFEKKYKSWRTRHLLLKSDGSLDSLISTGSTTRIDDTHDLTSVVLIKIRISDDSANVLDGRVGVKVFCKKDGHETNFRCIIMPRDLEGLCGALARVSRTHNIQDFLRSALVGLSGGPEPNTVGSGAISAFRAIAAARASWSMQRVVDKEDKMMMKRATRRRRGAFEDMPVLFSNDLVHGSWWFLLGAVFITAAASVVLANSYNEVIGTDDSFLSRGAYRASWILMVMSGMFLTIGSFAFVRAMNDPPMRPLFRCRHFATDELFGSWMFAVATLPGIPYCLIFLAYQRDLTYLAMLVFAVLSFLGSCLFVRGSYPVANESSKSKILSWLKCCCGRRRFFTKHCATDWLVGCWLMFWSSAVGTVGLFFFTVYYLYMGASSVANFANLCTFFDSIIFLVGAAYFVAGSYPPEDGGDDVIDLYGEVEDSYVAGYLRRASADEEDGGSRGLIVSDSADPLSEELMRRTQSSGGGTSAVASALGRGVRKNISLLDERRLRLDEELRRPLETNTITNPISNSNSNNGILFRQPRQCSDIHSIPSSSSASCSYSNGKDIEESKDTAEAAVTSGGIDQESIDITIAASPKSEKSSQSEEQKK